MCVCVFGRTRWFFSGNRHLAHHGAIVAVASATDAAAAFASTRNEQAFDMHSNNKRALILNE